MQGQGSGQPFYGPQIDDSRELRRAGLWDLGEIPAGGAGRIKAELWASSQAGSTRYTVSLGGQSFRSTSMPAAEWRRAEVQVAYPGFVNDAVSLASPKVDVVVTYPGSNELQRGWLDYVQLNHDAVLKYRGQLLTFRSNRHSSAGTYGFAMQAAPGDLQVWDVFDPLLPVGITTTNQGDLTQLGYRNAADGAPREFVAFSLAANLSRPIVRGEVRPSNLHSIARADLLIIYGEGLGGAADKLADHRRRHSGLAVETARMQDVANEFGGGRIDPSSIRNMASMLHSRDPQFRYLLLMGDGTYDPRQLIESVAPIIPTFQTKASNSEVTAFPTDDYFALLDENEGIIGTISYPVGGLDVAVGRIPAVLAADAEAVVEKIIRYDTDPALLGDWRLRNVYVADDEDSNRHIFDIDRVANIAADSFSQFNQTKIYVDAFEQVATSGGQRFPTASEEISRNMFRGNLITTYLGHGGPRGWGQERFLNAPDVERWNAADALPVLITATCTFTGFDDPERVVIGEQVLFKRAGGVVASLSTTRPVYTTANFNLTRATLKQFLDPDLATRLPVGTLLNMAKALTASSENTQNDRKFGLFGDPSMLLAVPEHIVKVTQIDSVDVETQTVLTAIAPLKEVSLSGEILTRDSTFAGDFSGELQLTVFDQGTQVADPGSRPYLSGDRI